MIEFKIADEKNFDEIKNIWCTCFSEPVESVKFFLENKFSNKNCFICIIDKKIVSMLFMIDTKINTGKTLEKAYYIYAAATLPEFQKQGLMGKLLDYSEKEAKKKGYKYSLLFPATENLYSFYEKYGYRRFFKSKIFTLNKEEFKSLAKDTGKKEKFLPLESISDLREKLVRLAGDIVWPKEFLQYAVKFNNFYGGKIIFSKNGYAIVRKNREETEILELCALKDEIGDIFSTVYELFKTETYVIKLKGNEDLLPFNGEIIDFGMIKPLEEKNDIENMILLNNFPYLGIALD